MTQAKSLAWEPCRVSIWPLCGKAPIQKLCAVTHQQKPGLLNQKTRTVNAHSFWGGALPHKGFMKTLQGAYAKLLAWVISEGGALRDKF